METINIRAITWNVEGTNMPENFNCSEMLALDTRKADIYIIGLQEVSSRIDSIFRDILVNGEDPWTNAVRRILAPHNYIKIQSIRYFGTVVTVFCLT